MTPPNALNTSSLPVAFRDTALTVAMLGKGTSSSSFAALRKCSSEQVRGLREELRADGQPEDVIRDAVYAQCALLDEAALSHLASADRDAWERSPLQVSEFGTHDAGDVLISRIQHRLHEHQPVRPVLAVFLAVLALGFRGRFAVDDADARAAMMQALSERLGTPGEGSGSVIVRSAIRPRWWMPLSLPVCVLLAAGMVVVVWVLLDRWLGAAAAQLVP